MYLELTIYADHTNYNSHGKLPESLIRIKFPTQDDKMRAEIRAGGV